MSRGYRITNLLENRSHLLSRKRTIVINFSAQTVPLMIFHHEVGAFLIDTKVENGNDVGVLYLARGFCFAAIAIY